MAKSDSSFRRPGIFNLVSASALMTFLPLLTYYMWICLDRFDGQLVFPRSWREWLSFVPAPTTSSLVLFLAWFLLQVVLQIAAPGKIGQGLPLADGSRLSYMLNGWFSFWFSLAAAVLLCFTGPVSPTILYDQFGPLLTTVNLFTFAFSLWLYWLGKKSPQRERTTGNSAYDYFMGTALNPRVRELDLKFFCETRPGLILWILINLSMAAKQLQLHGKVTTPMILVTAFQFLYVADCFFNEEALLTTWDIKHENFGWMLCWGDLVWVPFTYTIQALYLVNHTHELSFWATAGIVSLNIAGYWIFRASNIQKHRFRGDPGRLMCGSKPTYIETSRGTLLLTSGWWGISRHMNYFGDLLMGLAWCLPAGFEHSLPYFYIVYFTILLVHRERRDHAMCLEKYQGDWERYCAKVRWRIVPGVY
jgi:protein-S-isoprenylcysteine O-methyltransferase Ste14